MRVALHPELTTTSLQRGQEVVLNESLNVVLARSAEMSGEVVTLKEMLDDERGRSSSAGPTRSGWSSSPRSSSGPSCVPVTRC